MKKPAAKPLADYYLFSHDVHHYHNIRRTLLQKQVVHCVHINEKYLHKNSF